MAFGRELWCLVCAFVITLARPEVTLNDLSGVWRGYFFNSAENILTSKGPVSVCVEALSLECIEQIPFVEDTYTFNGSTISLEVRDRIGITTKAQAAEVMPACAKEGIYPFERRAIVPPSQVISYDSNAERIYYIDPRRPEETNCLPVRYRVTEGGGVYLEIDHFITFRGSVANLFALGVFFSCESLSKTCFQNLDTTEELDFGFEDVFNLTCIVGDCLNIAKATAPSALHAQDESPVDI